MLINAISPPKDPRPLADADKLKEITDSPFSMGHPTELPNTRDVVVVTEPTPRPTGLTSFGFGNVSYEGERHSEEIDRIMSDDVRTFTSSPKAASVALSPPSPSSPDGPAFPRTISFSSAVRGDLHRRARRGMTMLTTNQLVSPPSNDPGGKHIAKYEAYGGFPGPVNLAQRAMKRIAPTAYRKLERKLTIPYTTTLNGGNAPLVSSPVVSSALARHDSPPDTGSGALVGEDETPMEKLMADINAKIVTWLSFPLKVGRNSYFKVDELSDDKVEEIGGAEYRALRVLSYLVPCVSVVYLTAGVSFIVRSFVVFRAHAGARLHPLRAVDIGDAYVRRCLRGPATHRSETLVRSCSSSLLPLAEVTRRVYVGLGCSR